MAELNRQERSYLLKEAIREVLDNPQRHDELKQIVMQALTEWLEAKWAVFGKWTFRGMAAMAFTVLIYFFAKAKGLI